jgi:hypothetical protein
MVTAVIVLSGLLSLALFVIAFLWVQLMKVAIACCEQEAEVIRLKRAANKTT